MQETFEEFLHKMGGEPLGDKPGKDTDYGLETPGDIIHEVGTTRMGDDPKHQSPTNTNNYMMWIMSLLLTQDLLCPKQIKTVPGPF